MSTVEARAARRTGVVAVAIGIGVVTLKAFAAARTDSLALFADAAESLVNLVVALIATVSLGSSMPPAEGAAASGHGRLEYLSAVIEGGLVVVISFVVAFEAIARFGQAPQAAALATGLGLAVAATAINAVLARYLDRAGRLHRSPTLIADAIHLRGDVVISLLVFAGIGAAWASGTWRLDAALALGVALHILVSGLRAVRHSVSGLLDEALSADEMAAIAQRLGDEGPPVSGFEDLRAHRSGSQVFVEFRLLISRYALVYEAHEICNRLEADLGVLCPGARVSIRVEPERERRDFVGSLSAQGSSGG
jgi:cation diffusion facilitator family transporter